MTPTPRKRTHSLRRWIARRQEDILFLLGGGLIVVGTWHVLPVAAWFVAGFLCIVWSMAIAFGGRS